MHTPTTRGQFLVLAIVFWALIPITEAITDIVFLMLPHESIADSPAVAMMQVYSLAVIVGLITPIFGAFVWFIWRRYPGSIAIISFNNSRPVISSMLWLFFGALSLVSFSGVFFVRNAWDIPWALHSILASYFLLSCNAAISHAGNSNS